MLITFLYNNNIWRWGDMFCALVFCLSQNYRISRVESDPQGSSIPTLGLTQGHREHSSESRIQILPELKSWCHDFYDSMIPWLPWRACASPWPQSWWKTFFLTSNLNLPFCSLSFDWCHQREEINTHSSSPLVKKTWAAMSISSISSLGWTKQETSTVPHTFWAVQRSPSL